MRLSLAWPLPALLSWGAAWALFIGLRSHGLLALGLASALGLVLARLVATRRWRRLFVAIGFPLSLAMSGAAVGLPGWSWLIPLALLAALYPVSAWRDAPLFPTPQGALDGLAEAVPLPPGTAVLDAGCGLGNALVELRRVYPEATVEGIEGSRLLAALCRWRCRGFARVRCGDLWALDWSAYRVVYLFQRPESMGRAWEKARREMPPGSWLVSLEFEVPGEAATRRLAGVDGRTVWVYRRR